MLKPTAWAHRTSGLSQINASPPVPKKKENTPCTIIVCAQVENFTIFPPSQTITEALSRTNDHPPIGVFGCKYTTDLNVTMSI